MSKVIYLAAPYSCMNEMNCLALLFEKAGHIVNARWIRGGEMGQCKEDNAHMDYDDVAAADVLILKALPFGTYYKGGGRQWEFGAAYALGKKCIIVGEREQIFCHLRDIWVVDTYQQALELVNSWNE